MATFCLDCWNRINETDHDEKKYFISKGFCLCEGCGEQKHVIIAERKEYYLYKLRYFILPFRLLGTLLYILGRLLILPYILLQYHKAKKKDRL